MLANLWICIRLTVYIYNRLLQMVVQIILIVHYFILFFLCKLLIPSEKATRNEN